MLRGLGPNFWIFQQVPSLQAFALSLPDWLASRMSPAVGTIIRMQGDCIRQIEAVRSRMSDGKLSQSDKEGRPTIFTQLLDPQKQDGWPVPSTWELKDEVLSLIAAAADKTGNAMTISSYHVMKNPAIYAKLRAELLAAFPDASGDLSFVELEKLPYLTGVIKEGLRLSFGVPGRLAREVPPGGATFNGFFLPEGTAVGMSSWILHHDEKFFPDANAFNPERWTDPQRYRDADRAMMPFGGGSRQCVGMPLAYSELYVAVGTLFRKFGGLKVYKTTEWDLEFDDYFSAYHIPGRNWFKATGPDFEE
jgi:cytochrome P450